MPPPRCRIDCRAVQEEVTESLSGLLLGEADVRIKNLRIAPTADSHPDGRGAGHRPQDAEGVQHYRQHIKKHELDE